MGPEFLAILIIVAVLAGGTKSGRNFLREAHKATGWRTPRTAVQHHSDRLGALTGRGIASGARVSGRGARLAARNASAGIWNRNGRPLIPLMWRPGSGDEEDSADGGAGAWPAVQPVRPAGFWRSAKDGTLPPDVDDVMTPGPADYGPGPWAMHFRSRGGRKINALKDLDTETIAVWDPEDLRRRLDGAAGDPDLEVRVTPLPPSDGPSSAGTGTGPAPDSNPARKETSQMTGSGPARITGSHAADPEMNDYIEAAYDLPPGEAARRAGNTVWSARPTGTAHRRGNMPTRYAINLEPPTTDGEFLETCIQIGDVLKGLAEDIGNWADGLGGLKLPQSVTNPLHQVSDGITDAAAGANQAATNFEAEFEDARDVAAAGMTITGQDAA